MAFKPQLTIPEKGDPYYNRKPNGYSIAIKGKPCQEGLDVLSNCSGYAYGRYHSICEDKSMHYLSPVNAGDFVKYADKSLVVSQKPSLGAVAVWKKAGGAGHVAIVEQINADGSIVTSESGYGSSKVFWTKTRKPDARWGQNILYTFVGFIYQPGVKEEVDVIPKGMVRLDHDSVYYTSVANAKAKLKPVKVKAGDYYVYKTYGAYTNITKRKSVAGGWIATSELKK